MEMTRFTFLFSVVPPALAEFSHQNADRLFFVLSHLACLSSFSFREAGMPAAHVYIAGDAAFFPRFSRRSVASAFPPFFTRPMGADVRSVRVRTGQDFACFSLPLHTLGPGGHSRFSTLSFFLF